MQILVLEDDELSRQLLRDLLEHRGHRVVEAADVAQGLVHVRNGELHAALLDLGVPGGGGDVVAREIRQHPLLSRIPVIAVTALARATIVDRLAEAGFDAYMGKPINTRALWEMVESMVETSRKAHPQA